ncbi:hypothetical protein U9M48_020267 [Paspalum notatum var. saurae]|uniref:Uncharacterized protein n=1 Tax=Paspalum notatum var. saurae TaxID=547442 RepID=A0AAQ3TEF6_PASNO
MGAGARHLREWSAEIRILTLRVCGVVKLRKLYPMIATRVWVIGQFPELSMAVFADALKPEKFSGVHFKRWQIKCTLWLEAMHVFWVSKGKPEGDLSDADLQRFTEANTLFRGTILSALTDRLVDVYMHIKDGKELWDALEAHDIQCIAKELEILKCSLPDPFVAGCIIAKLPSSWRSFAIALKHKRTKISVEELIASLDVEEKARAKDTKGGEGHSVANTVQNQRNQGKGKGKFKPNKTTNFKKKKNKAELPCFTCGELGHFSKDCPERADRRGKRGGNGQSSKTVNTVTASKTGDAGYGNLPTVFSVTRDCSVLMGNGSAASVLGTGTVDLKFTSGKIVQLKNVQHVPSMNKNLISGSLLLRDGFKVALESNKVVVSGHGLFIGKGYVSGGLFRLSLSDFSNKCVNHICGGVNDDASLWHGRLCHVNFGLMKQLSSMSLIPSFTFAKGSKCHSCVQSKQPRKPHKAAEPRNLAPLELIHSDLCEMNGVLTKGGKRYFMTLIDDATRFCYVYLLKSKDETLDYFKIYKAEVENQLERKIKHLRSDRGGEYFPKVFDDFCAEHDIIHERTPSYFSESNGVAERKNRTLTDLVNSMLDIAGLSKAWWGEAILTSCHVLNRVPNKNKDKTPYEEWIGRKPSLSYLRTWGCLAKVNVPINKKSKLGPKTVDCIFLEYAHQSIAYRFLVVKSDVPDMYVDTIMESRDATFFENIFPMKDMHSTSRFSSEITPELNASIEVFEPPRKISPEEDNNEAPRKSKRQRVEKSFGNDFIVYLMDDTPTSISEAYASPDADNWKEAVQSELDSILSNGTWELTERPYGCKPVGSFLNGELEEEIYMEQPDGFVVKGQENKVYIDVINEVKSFLSTKFDMKDLGEADVILNIKLIKDESGITLSQTHYVEKNKRIGVNQLKYSRIIGSLMYLASATGPDISFAVSKLSRFMSNPGTDHWHALERVMCYLKGTMSYGIHYSGHPAVLEGYSDANWISDDELYATSGYVFMLGGGAVSWRSCKQTILTRSTMEAELAALDTASVEADWLRDLLMDLPVVEKPIPAILMNRDNRIAIAKVNGDKKNAKSSRHVRRRVKSVRKMRHSGVISVTYIQTEKNLADPFMKGLSRNVIDIASREMGLRPI